MSGVEVKGFYEVLPRLLGFLELLETLADFRQGPGLKWVELVIAGIVLDRLRVDLQVLEIYSTDLPVYFKGIGIQFGSFRVAPDGLLIPLTRPCLFPLSSIGQGAVFL